MSGANTYSWTYLNTPVTSGTTTGTASTFTIAGPPTVAAAGGNYASRVIAGVTSIPSGTVAAPSLVFGTTANTSGLYSSGANVVNVGISGTAIATVNSTGLTIAGTASATTLVAGFGSLGNPSIYLGTDTTTGFFRYSGSTWGFMSAGTTYTTLSSLGVTTTGAIVNGPLNANGDTYCNSSTNYMLTRCYKGSSTAAAGVVTFQLQTNLGGTRFGADGAGVYLVTMSLQTGDYGSARGFWSGYIELSNFAGGKASGFTSTSSSATFTSVSTTGLLTITVSAGTSSVYEFTQMQVCY
jgi:hypothetical protein